MPSTRNPSVVSPGPGKLPTGVASASALLFQTSGSGSSAGLFRPIAIPTHADYTAGGGGDASKSLTAAGTAWIWTGDSGSILAPDLFLVSDQNDHPLWIGSTLVKVASISGAAIGDGFVAGPVTLTFNVLIPAATTYRIYYAVREDLSTIPTDVWSAKIIRNSAEGAAYQFADSTNFKSNVLGDITTDTGGIGTVTNTEQAFERVDSRLTKLRDAVATVTDGISSVGGDFENTIIDTLIDSGLGTLGSGRLAVRPGAYAVTDAATAWNNQTSWESVGPDTEVVLDVGRTSNLPVLVASFRGPNVLVTNSPLYCFEVQGDFVYEGDAGEEALVFAGALALNPSFALTRISIRNIVGTQDSTRTNALGGLDITGTGQFYFENMFLEDFGATGSTPNGALYIHNITDSNATLTFVNCTVNLRGSVSGVDVLALDTVRCPTKFTNCKFIVDDANGDPGDCWALNAIDCAEIIFENCIFQTTKGQGVRCENSGITFKDCYFLSFAGLTSPLASPQLLCGEGAVIGGDEGPAMRIINCYATFDATNVVSTGVGAVQPIIELGGRNATSYRGTVHVDGLYIRSQATTVHNYTTVVLHDNSLNNTNSTYNDITIDMNGAVPGSSGTISQFDSLVQLLPGFGGHILEVYGESGNRVRARNIKVVGVGLPSGANTPRSVVCLVLADIDGLFVNGAAPPSGSFVYSGPLIQSVQSNLRHAVSGQTDEILTTDLLHIENSLFASTYEDCLFSLDSSPYDTWTVHVKNSFLVEFINCEFGNSAGQVLRNENSGVTYRDVLFQGTTNTTLTNPQLICGEGDSTSGFNFPLKFINCLATFRDGNVRSGVSTPTKAIIELGGHDNTAVAGTVIVDGLHVVAGTGIGVHNFSTVLFHNTSSNPSPNQFDNVTIDMASNDPGAPAGNKTYFTSWAVRGAPVLEIVGEGSPAGRVRVNNLQLVNIGAPSAAVAREVLSATQTTIHGLVIDGSTPDAGNYTAPIYEAYQNVDTFDLQMWPKKALISVYFGGGYVKQQFGCNLNGFRYQHHDVWDYTTGSADSPFFTLGTDSSVQNARVYIDTTNPVKIGGLTPYGLFELGLRSKLLDSYIFCNEMQSGTTLQGFVHSTSEGNTVANNIFRWDNVAPDLQILHMTGDFAVVTGNQFLTTSANVIDIPTYSITGANQIDINIAAKGASSVAPNIY
jgi:hypothetical protein